jgi:hypothetical protein
MPEEGDGFHFILHDICPRAKPILMCPAENFVHSWLTIEVQVHIISIEVDDYIQPTRSADRAHFLEKNEFVTSHSGA